MLTCYQLTQAGSNKKGGGDKIMNMRENQSLGKSLIYDLKNLSLFMRITVLSAYPLELEL